MMPEDCSEEEWFDAIMSCADRALPVVNGAYLEVIEEEKTRYNVPYSHAVGEANWALACILGLLEERRADKGIPHLKLETHKYMAKRRANK
tara:strand:+ start:962 stop:1234 length:273 start_codon:yes stop_codon:yes gene_type:complete